MSNVTSGIDRFSGLEILSERAGDEHVVRLIGELDLSDADRVTAELMRAESTDAARIVLDLSRLEFIDSTGIRLIVAADMRSRADGDRLRLVAGTAPVQRVFALTGLLEHLPFAG